MLYYKDNKFIKEDYKSTVYIENYESPVISYIHDKEWFEEIQHRIFNISKEDIIYEDFVLTKEQQSRLDEINEFGYIEEYNIGYVVDYVLNGVYPEFDNHPLRIFQLEKENKSLKLQLFNLTNLITADEK